MPSTEQRQPASQLIYLREEGIGLYCQGMCAAPEGVDLALYALYLLHKLIEAACITNFMAWRGAMCHVHCWGMAEVFSRSKLEVHIPLLDPTASSIRAKTPLDASSRAFSEAVMWM